MPTKWDILIEDFDDAANVVTQTRYQMFQSNLTQWFSIIDDNPVSLAIVTHLQALVDFAPWYKAAEQTMGGMVGSGTLRWPSNRDERLGMQLSLFREFEAERIDLIDFCSKFMYSDNYDAMVGDVAGQLFAPMVRDLRRRLIRAGEPLPDGDLSIPASDRVVTLDHNSDRYKELMDAIQNLETALQQFNEGEPEEKEQRQAELSAGRRLLEAARVRIEALMVVLGRALTYLIKTFTNSVVGKAAAYVLDLLLTWLNIK